MKTNYRLFGGILLIGAGLVALLQTQGYLTQLAPQVWVALFAAISVVALFAYASSGWKEWGWLFPAGVFAGLAVTISLGLTGINKSFIATPLFVGLLVPFIAAYLADRTRNGWALIPGGIMLFLALATLLADLASDAWIGTLALLMMALCFLAVFLNKRTRVWALPAAYIFAVLSVAPLMSTLGRNGDYFGPVLFLAIALPFYVLYFRSAARWWAIIPAGVLTTIAVVAALAISGVIHSQTQDGYGTALMMVGLAATFAIVGWRNAKRWAKTVTVVLLAIAVAAVVLVNQSQMIGALAIIVLGGYLLVTALRPKTA